MQLSAPSDEESPEGATTADARGALASPTALLIILALINFLNYVDRFVIGGLTVILQDPNKGLGLSSKQIGFLSSAFMIVHSVASIPLGLLADRYLRKRLISFGVMLWSIMTAAAAFASSFGQLFVSRAAVGIGEATYAPAASALISDRFHPAQRARALGAFQLGMVLGSAVGLIAGGIVGQHWGWRAAFVVVGLPGILLAVLMLLVYEPVRPRRPRRSAGFSFRVPSGTPYSLSAAFWIACAGIGTTFFTGGLAIWGPKFMLRVLHGGDLSYTTQVSLTFGPLVLVASVLGTLAGGTVADRLERQRAGTGRLLTVAISIFGAAPCAAVAFLSTNPLVLYSMLFCGAFFAVFYVGPILAALHDVVPPEIRATATGAYFAAIHLLGDALSPTVVGWIDDATGSLQLGLLVATGVLLLGGVAALFALSGSRRVALAKAEQARR